MGLNVGPNPRPEASSADHFRAVFRRRHGAQTSERPCARAVEQIPEHNARGDVETPFALLALPEKKPVPGFLCRWGRSPLFRRRRLTARKCLGAGSPKGEWRRRATHQFAACSDNWARVGTALASLLPRNRALQARRSAGSARASPQIGLLAKKNEPGKAEHPPSPSGDHQTHRPLPPTLGRHKAPLIIAILWRAPCVIPKSTLSISNAPQGVESPRLYNREVSGLVVGCH